MCPTPPLNHRNQAIFILLSEIFMGFASRIYGDKSLVVADVNGLLDLESSKDVIEKIIENPEHRKNHKILIDLRGVEFNISVIDVYRLAKSMASDTELIKDKIAVLINDNDDTLNRVDFLETCSRNRGLKMKSFIDFESACKWLEVNRS
jgi:hypothetical protein